MRCTYCETVIAEYPADGLCPNCGGRLPPRPAGKRCPDCGSYSTGSFCAVCGYDLRSNTRQAAPQPQPQPQPQTVYIQVPQGPLVAGVNCCPKCSSPDILFTKRGFRWGLAIFGFFLFPVFGLLLGFCKGNLRYGKCRTCGYKWKRR